MIYKDFDLLLERAPKGFRAQVLSSSAGQATVDFQLPFSDVELENFLLKLGRTTRVVRRIESTEMTTAKSFGAALFNAVFAGDVRACLRSAVDEARRENTRVRLRIRLADPVLADLPWEFLYNPAVNRFLALSADAARQIHGAARGHSAGRGNAAHPRTGDDLQPVGLSGARRRGGVDTAERIAGRPDLGRHDRGRAPGRRDAAPAAAASAFAVPTSFISSATANSTRRCKKVLLLERANKRGHRIGSQYLGMLLHDQDSLRLAILNACEGARSSRQDPFAGSAQSLVQQGIPAVIAMQFEIADDVASTFAHEFYGALADGLPIDASVTEARKAIFAGGREIEWATPVLYLRAPDGRIFDVAPAGKTAAPVTAPEPATSGKVTVTSPAAPVPATPRERAAALLRAASRLLALGNYKEAMEQLVEARPLDPDSATLAELTATAEEQRAVADTRELLKQRGGRATIAEAAARPRDRAPAAKADTAAPSRPAGASGRPTTRAI